MAKQNAEATLAAVTTGLTKLSELTEAVKTFVEKNEAGATMPIEDWTTAIQSFQPWMNQVLETLGTETKTETVTAETVVATETVETKQDDTVTETTTVTDTATTTEVSATGATSEATTTNETVVTAETTATAAETVDSLVKAVSALSAAPTAEELEKAVGGYDKLYISGGLFIDSYDIEALAMVCNAICGAMGGDDVAKSADKIIAEVSKRTAAVAKRVAETTKATDTDGKELKVASMLLKTLKESVAKAETKKTTETTVTTQAIDQEALTALINAAVTKAVAPLIAETSALKAQVTKVENEKVDLAKQLNTALATPATRASSQEQVTNSQATTTTVRVNRNGVTDYNEPN